MNLLKISLAILGTRGHILNNLNTIVLLFYYTRLDLFLASFVSL